MKRFVSLILSVCFLFSINTVSYAANISSRKASNPVIQSMNDKYHVDFSGMSIDELNKFIDKMKDEDQTRAFVFSKNQRKWERLSARGKNGKGKPLLHGLLDSM